MASPTSASCLRCAEHLSADSDPLAPVRDLSARSGQILRLRRSGHLCTCPRTAADSPDSPPSELSPPL